MQPLKRHTEGICWHLINLCNVTAYLLRARAQGNAWAALWAAAPATPAAQQAPLMDAEAEGERALHALVRSATPLHHLPVKAATRGCSWPRERSHVTEPKSHQGWGTSVYGEVAVPVWALWHICRRRRRRALRCGSCWRWRCPPPSRRWRRRPLRPCSTLTPGLAGHPKRCQSRACMQTPPAVL
jgi:Rab3 GTPase-activating protein catalytic subunit